ncbi:TIGR01457 family HAD-type hydrolase [Tetragenococcus koreensis]|uniref:Acid sugar phosphatase n=1 Tax=Tetragenococcus koreensis TaxID=290335 RepID=A0AAN4ZQP6_9ENTE|nr:TIGR01457 family HAD-type hydrolase [Tetragenococcus koreensis]AYW45636.1 TIGR01457 family HAD-type hydrolase [Tetragenococcus koreensis]MCF1585770.1 TIGR01457 family HAD-type hydrolase [Tetragenococcus koreensis]MCF1615273.1 TIGR01457 family HAD-type hydrolase [Tetragenococcus koreensis]MCF1617605.1 TIGR01457 family HAD-type hydrolase [Tetragenococcus koreensis]MCF1620164.1 TIGR01457 family HAD-type hydrolase [Tetragenococcus koreensis]
MAYKGYLVDMDGTIYLGSKPIPAGKRFVDTLQEKGLPFLFVTNNTTKSPETVQKRLADEFNIQVGTDLIYTASLATIDYMKDDDKGDKVYVIGEAGLIDLILEAGFEWDENNPDYVVVGLDSQVTYEKFTIATLAVQKGATFIGTNSDKNLPNERGLVPGAGALISLLETATQTEPIYVGKPEAVIMEKALDRIGLTKDEVLMVGDNYETDIRSGINNGIDTLLVLSGFTPKEAVPSLPVAPTYVLDSLDEWDIDK